MTKKTEWLPLLLLRLLFLFRRRELLEVGDLLRSREVLLEELHLERDSVFPERVDVLVPVREHDRRLDAEDRDAELGCILQRRGGLCRDRREATEEALHVQAF